jgi:hypothetical protein
MQDFLVKCCRCRNKHKESERVQKPNNKYGIKCDDLVCPRCECKSYYRLEELKKEDKEGADNV